MGADDKQLQFSQTEKDMQGLLPDPGWSLEQKLALAARMLHADGHGSGLAGQLSARAPEPGTYCTLAFGLGFDEARASTMIRYDDNLRVVAGRGMPNPANRFHLWIYRARPDVRAIVHTHPPNASALSMVGEKLVVAHMDATPLFDDCAYLPTWPGVPVADYEGRIISEALGSKRAILLAHHGLLTAGASVEEAATLAIYFERACTLQLKARAIGPIQAIGEREGSEAHDFLLKPAITNATFHYFGRQVLRTAPEVLQ